MEDIVQYIVTRLLEREQRCLSVSSKKVCDINQRGMKDYLYHKKIIIKDVGAILLKKIAEMDTTNEWVQYILEAFNYGCDVYLQLSFQHPTLIPPYMLVNSPVHLINQQGNEYVAFDGKFICYQDVALLHTQHVVLLGKNQYLTDLARERLKEKKVSLIERGVFSC